MNKIFIAGAVAATTAFAATTAMAGECSTAMLKGHYTYWLQGFDEAGKPYAEVGEEHYDGAGKVVTRMAVAGSEKIVEDSGTYTVSDNCAGTVTYASGASDNIFLAPNGDSFVFGSAKAGVVQIGENTRVAND